MLSKPSILGHLIGGIAHRTIHTASRLLFGSDTPHTQRDVTSVPYHIWHRRVKNHFDPTDASTKPRDCCVFRYVDALWQSKTTAEKAIWHKAVKRRHYSGYDLWMSEALYCCLHAQRPPDSPSISGGFSPRKAVPGTVHPIPPCLVYIPVRLATVHLLSINDAAQLALWQLDITWNPPFPAGYTPVRVRAQSIWYGAFWEFYGINYPQTHTTWNLRLGDYPTRVVFTVEPSALPIMTYHLSANSHWTITRPGFLPFEQPPDPTW